MQAMLLSLLLTGPTATPPNVETLLQHIDDLYRSKSSIARIEILVTDSRTIRSLRLKAWTRGEEQVRRRVRRGCPRVGRERHRPD